MELGAARVLSGRLARLKHRKRENREGLMGVCDGYVVVGAWACGERPHTQANGCGSVG